MADIRRSAVAMLTGALILSLGVAAPGVALADEGITVRWTVVSDSGAEFTVSGDVRNGTSAAIVDPAVVIPFAHTVSQVTGMLSVQDGSSLTLQATPGTALQPGEGIGFTLSVASGAPVSRVPSTCSSEDVECELVIIEATPDAEESGSEEGPTEPPSEEPQEPIPGTDDDDPPADEQPEPLPSEDDAPPGPSEASVPEGPSTESGQNHAAHLRVTVERSSDWGAGQVAAVTVRNEGPSPIREWAVEFDWRVQVVQMWNAASTSGGGVVRSSSMSWNGSLAPGEAAQVGLIASPGGVAPVGDSCSATSDAGRTTCTLVLD
ncbi:MAG: cellulose binding domain-containing protein [Candidatus Nanopelagicales bacterium]|nr:cellulose binding domain-containing protein [Candidatus Nanopelagicales bacterium]MDZ4250037.1 cellulose binding domain-containing protein [Candidatus Nanopelagicales bacterium]